ncbi:MAG: hypothetical protein ACFFGZ_03715 [Candidatus Thorarchaeota archaeon]
MRWHLKNETFLFAEGFLNTAKFEGPLSVTASSMPESTRHSIPMGRTIATFRETLESERSQWQAFRRSLRATSRQAFDQLWVAAFRHADAATNNPQVAPLDNILLSMLVDLQRQILGLKKSVEGLKSGNNSPVLPDNK